MSEQSGSVSATNRRSHESVPTGFEGSGSEAPGSDSGPVQNSVTAAAQCGAKRLKDSVVSRLAVMRASVRPGEGRRASYLPWRGRKADSLSPPPGTGTGSVHLQQSCKPADASNGSSESSATPIQAEEDEEAPSYDDAAEGSSPGPALAPHGADGLPAGVSEVSLPAVSIAAPRRYLKTQSIHTN